MVDDRGRKVVDGCVIPALGLPITLGALLLVGGPLSWFTYYGSSPGETGAMVLAVSGLVWLVLGTAAWAVTWRVTRRRRGRVRVPLLLVALLLAPSLFSWSTFGPARTRWCELSSVDGHDPRLNSITGPLAPHCTPADRIGELSS